MNCTLQTINQKTGIRRGLHTHWEKNDPFLFPMYPFGPPRIADTIMYYMSGQLVH
jgi:hypothetical protein